MKIVQRIRRNSCFLYQVQHLSKTDGGYAHVVPCGDCLLDKIRSSLPESRIGKEVPDRGMRIRYGDSYQKSERGKFANISARFSSISPADGAGPYFARRPRNERVGSFPEAVSPAVASRIPSSASRTNSAAERPRACATAISLASSCGCSGKVMIMARASGPFHVTSTQPPPAPNHDRIVV